MKTPYIKPTSNIHDSSFECFEVGYCDINDKNEAIDIEKLGEWTDHIMIYNGIPNLNLDLTVNGYIRFFSFDRKLKWDSAKYALSSMRIVLDKEVE